MTLLDSGLYVPEEHDVFWEPSPRQSEFLSCPDFEVLYGGAAGGGKTDGLLIDLWALPYGGPDNPKHRAVFFRRTFPELQDAIARSHELFPDLVEGCTYNSVDHLWTAPSGATFRFGHMQHNKDRFKHRGFAYNCIGFDELTLWPDDVCYLYLLSRLRSTDRSLPRWMRATTNPDGPGQRWVMERWGITEKGGPSRVVKPIDTEEWDEELQDYKMVLRNRARTFIPAKLKDNSHLRGTGYRENLMMLHPEEREALLEGIWRGALIKGSYYLKEMQQARAENRICRVPHHAGVPVNTFWDLGANDLTVIGCHQTVGLENRWLRCYGNSGEKLAHYADYIKGLAREHGYVFGTHYLPHDANNERLEGNSVVRQLQELLPGENFTIVDRVDHVINGINRTRSVMSTCFFDEVECVDLIAALDHYRKHWDEKLQVFTQTPVHDIHSDYADMIRQFGQGFGPVQKFIKPVNWRSQIKKQQRARTGAMAR